MKIRTVVRDDGGPSRYRWRRYDAADAPERFEQEHFAGQLGAFLKEHQEGILLGSLPPGPARGVLDVGAGTGRAARVAQHLGFRVVIFDASFPMLLAARGRLQNGVRAVRGDAHHLPFRPRSFDAVVELRLLMHLSDWRRGIRDACRVAASTVIVDFPPRSSVAVLAPLFNHLLAVVRPARRPHAVLSVRQVVAVLGECGFRVARMERQLVLPFTVHRLINRVGCSRATEGFLRWVGLTKLFGAPVTVVARREHL